MHDRSAQLTVVSNRLPVVMRRGEEGWNAEPGSGGLVQAMNPILAENGGCWVGWPGVTAEDGDGWQQGVGQVESRCDYRFEPVVLTDEEYRGYYRGFANAVIWPLFHGFANRCEFDPQFYDAYQRVNAKFADAVADCDGKGFLWAHDYHLLQLGRRLREKGYDGRIGFFLHIPFPEGETFWKLPWGEQLLGDLLHYDMIGFQTERDLSNFRHCVDRIGIEGEGDTEGSVRFELGGRTVEAGAFPIGIDYRSFASRAEDEQVSQRVEQLRDRFGVPRVVLGVDRLDYSKGLIEKLQAFERVLQRHPELLEEVVLFQLVVPSRESVPAYRRLKREFDRLVGRINGRYSTLGWQPIHYRYDSVQPRELAALYRMASVGLVTSIRDGMNLVSKEYCACQVDNDGALVLSRFAGSRQQLGEEALVVNPYDTDETAEAIWRALAMDPDQRGRRMKAMRQSIAATDVFWWAESFMRRVRSQDETLQHVVDTDPEKMSLTGEHAGS